MIQVILFLLMVIYLRVLACKECGLDTVKALIHEENEEQAILSILKSDQNRSFQAIEQGLLLNELANRYDHSLSELARLIGKDKSWVHRRLVASFILQLTLLSNLNVL